MSSSFSSSNILKVGKLWPVKPPVKTFAHPWIEYPCTNNLQAGMLTSANA